ncbi:hypothetical protein [Falsiruegeria mediterranea]|uniref:hypothetical protein n=1 Tax=Falsiruegeria mediterranea TaxID=1280832 RepID=UPI0015F24CAC|nr:hypothetical protein [Falsiruegeria mediterranea]
MQLTISSGFCRKTEKPDLREECSEDVERADFVEKVVGFGVARLATALILLNDRC